MKYLGMDFDSKFVQNDRSVTCLYVSHLSPEESSLVQKKHFGANYTRRHVIWNWVDMNKKIKNKNIVVYHFQRLTFCSQEVPLKSAQGGHCGRN